MQLRPDPRQVVVVVDIGCVALTREHLATNWLLGLHGRSVTYATGIKLAKPSLKVIVLIGDGGVGIGGHHLINAARRNVGLTVVVFNNLNFGMTGGEHSVTTPQAAITATTAYGHLERPLDVCDLMVVSGASFVARATSFDRDLPDLFAEALRNDGFSVVDVWEPCTSYFVPNNRFGRKQMFDTLADLGFSTGIICREPRPEYSRAYRDAVAPEVGQPLRTSQPLTPKYRHQLTSRLRCVVAGAAGKKIVSAATLFCQGAMLSGLQVAQRSEYPVTVKSGYSVPEVVLSPEEILSPEISKPDRMVVLFPEGLKRVQAAVDKLTADDLLYVSANLPHVDTPAKTVRLDFARAGAWGKRKDYWALIALAYLLRREGLYPIEALEEAIVDQKAYVRNNLTAAAAAADLDSADG